LSYFYTSIYFNFYKTQIYSFAIASLLIN
jgi:hypothetical protein